MTYAYIDEPPFGAPGPRENPIGYDCELAELVLRRMGVERIDSRLTTFAELIPGVVSGAWTMNTGMFVTPERSALVRFSHPIWSLIDGLVVLAGNPKRIKCYEDVARSSSAILGVVAGNVQIENAIKAGVPLERMKAFRSQLEVMQQVLVGSVDAYAGAALAHRGILRRMPDSPLEIIEIETLSDTAPVGAYSFHKSNSLFAENFDKHLREIVGSAEHIPIAEAHGLSPAESLAGKFHVL